MTQLRNDQTLSCQLCGESTTVRVLGLHDLYKFTACRCGAYLVERCDYQDFLEDDREVSVDDRRKLSALVREHGVRGGLPLFLQFKRENYAATPNTVEAFVPELLHSRWPTTIGERLDRTLRNLGRLTTRPGTKLQLLQWTPSLAFARDGDEANQHERFLIEEGLLARGGDGVSLTLKGLRKYEELTRPRQGTGDRAFVAMWFGDGDSRPEFDSLYTESIESAIERAGYKSKRADSEEHINFIMDEVLGSIRLAPFVVADFTGNRNGVYLEAGFARGLGIPVIHTCREDHFAATHFDIKQINTIRWKLPADLHEQLFHRIMRVIGPGHEYVAQDA